MTTAWICLSRQALDRYLIPNMFELFIFFAIVLCLQINYGAPGLQFDKVASGVWLFTVGLNFLPVLEYNNEISGRTIWLIAASHLLLVGGFQFWSRASDHPTDYQGQVGGASVVLAGLSALFILATIAANISRGTVPIVGALSGLSRTRGAYLAGEIGGTWIDQIVSVARFPALAFVSLGPLFHSRGTRQLLMLAVVTGVSLVDYSFSIGQRASVVFALIAIATCYSIIHGQKVVRYLLVGILFLPIFYWLGSSFYLARSADFGRNPEYFVSLNCANADYGDLVRDSSDELKALSLSSCYFSSPIHNFDIFLEKRGESWTHRHGRYNAAIGFPEVFEETRRSIAKYNRRMDHAENPWSTGVRDFWLDFGAATPLAFLALGGLAGSASRRRTLWNEMQLARSSFLVVAGAMTPLISPLLLRSIVYTIISAHVLEFVWRAFLRQRVSVPESHSSAELLTIHKGAV